MINTNTHAVREHDEYNLDRPAPLTQKIIDRIFEDAESQGDAWYQLYLIALPMYDDLESVDGYPTVTTKTWEYICEGFIKLDKRVHPHVLAGGLWMNLGFAIETGGKDWQVYRDEVTLHYK